MWAIFFKKSLLNLLQCCFCFMFWFFGGRSPGILGPWPEIEPATPALEGSSLCYFLLKIFFKLVDFLCLKWYLGCSPCFFFGLWTLLLLWRAYYHNRRSRLHWIFFSLPRGTKLASCCRWAAHWAASAPDPYQWACLQHQWSQSSIFQTTMAVDRRWIEDN